MGVTEEIQKKLEGVFSPTELSVVDDSEKHRGHAGYQEGGESHFNVLIKAEIFADMTRIERHRAVHNALGKELVSRIHALALQISG